VRTLDVGEERIMAQHPAGDDGARNGHPYLVAPVRSLYLGGYRRGDNIADPRFSPPVLLSITEEAVWVDTDANSFRRPTPLFSIPFPDLITVEVDELLAAHRRGYTLSTGLFGVNRMEGQAASVTLILRSGESALFRVNNAFPAQIRAAIAPLTRWLAQGAGSPAVRHADPTGKRDLRWWDGAAHPSVRS
jgi:hypothetical protein